MPLLRPKWRRAIRAIRGISLCVLIQEDFLEEVTKKGTPDSPSRPVSRALGSTHPGHTPPKKSPETNTRRPNIRGSGRFSHG